MEWLGDVPSHWQIGAIKRLTQFTYGDALPAELRDDFGDVPVFGSNGVVGSHSAANTVAPVIMIGRKGSCGALNWSDVPSFAIDTVYFVDKFTAPTNIRWFWWTLHLANLASASQDTGVPGLSREFAHGVLLPISSISEQSAIATFLDRETAKIDALVAEQERLIELLKEKRQAVISHAVTEGLNPEVKMKDSGVEWLGEVPEHWKQIELKRVASIQYGIGEPPRYNEYGTPLIRATNVSAGRITPEGMVFVDPADIPEKRIIWLEPGDIIVVRSGAYTGDSAIIKDEHCPSIAGFDMVVKPHDCVPEFLQYALLSHYLKSHQIDLERIRAAQPHINAEELGHCFLLLPLQYEQREIVAFLNHQTERFDMLMAQATRAIDLLRERRSALISAAVTGKIDVRGLVELAA